MPHVVVKLLQGRTEAQKSSLAEAVANAVMATANCPESAVSVAIEDIGADRWTEDVYKPDILGRWANVYKKPGYEPS